MQLRAKMIVLTEFLSELMDRHPRPLCGDEELDGVSLADMTFEIKRLLLEEKRREPERIRFRDLAKELDIIREGEVEIDDNALVSIGDEDADGAYVQAWIWIPKPEASND